MLKKTLLSAAIASSFALSGCLDDTPKTGENAGSFTNPNTSTAVYPIFSPAESAFPIPNDLMFDSTAADASLLDPASPGLSPVTDAIGKISGASTVAPIDIAMNGELDADSVVGPADPVNQNVFLIAVNYAGGSAVKALSIGDTPDVASATQPSYSVEVIEVDGASTIRIHPTTPLSPATRYVVAVTNAITDASGNAIIQSPGAAGYAAVSNENAQFIGSLAALSGAQSLANSFWEPVSLGTINAQKVATSQDTITEDNLALSYSFTTSGDEKVLEYIANPTEWFADQLASYAKVSAVTQTIAANPGVTVSYADLNTAALTAVGTFPGALGAALPTLFGSGAPCDGTIGLTAIGCAATTLAGSFSALLPTPAAATAVNVDDANGVMATAKSVLLQTIDSGNAVKIVEGNITLPYYLGVPSGTDGATINTSDWVADDTLAAAMQAAFANVPGFTIPQADPDVSTVVNYAFPFPKKQSDVSVPFTAIYSKAVVDGDLVSPTVIYQHGITLDRSASLAFGTALAKSGFTVITIDQPVHGILPATDAQKDSLAGTLLETLNTANPALPGNSDANRAALIDGSLLIGTVGTLASLDPSDPTDLATIQGTISLVIGGGTSGNATLDGAILALKGAENAAINASSTIPGIAPTTLTGATERHFGFTADATLAPVEIGSATASGGSGSLFINLLNFTNSRDKLRQGALDLMTVAKTLSVLDLDGDADADVSIANVNFAGQSLGTVNGIPFVSSWNAAGGTPAITGASFQVPGGGITKLLENSPAFAPQIIGGLSAAGVSQGSGDFENFLRIFQAALDSVDPINFADNLNDACAYANVFQTCATTTSIAVAEISGSASRLPDLVIPNETYNQPLDSTIATSKAKLSGTDPLVAALGLTNTLDGSAAQVVSRYNQGSHGTFVLPQVSPTETVTETLDQASTDTLNAERLAVFTENSTQAGTLFGTGATGAANTAILNDEATHATLRAAP